MILNLLATVLLAPSLFLLFFLDPVKNFTKEYTLVEIRDKTYNFEVANTPYKKSKGLKYTRFGDKEGMLFFYNNKRPAFYNENVQFDLRVYWVAKNKIVGSDVFKKYSPKIYRPAENITSVIEIPLNESKSNDPGELVGDFVKFL